jgi:hypothetical protein
LIFGNKDLQQCADAVMRLRAMWLHEEGREIHFEDNWKILRFTSPPLSNSIPTCKRFQYCGTSLEKQLNKQYETGNS